MVLPIPYTFTGTTQLSGPEPDMALLSRIPINSFRLLLCGDSSIKIALRITTEKVRLIFCEQFASSEPRFYFGLREDSIVFYSRQATGQYTEQHWLNKSAPNAGGPLDQTVGAALLENEQNPSLKGEDLSCPIEHD